MKKRSERAEMARQAAWLTFVAGIAALGVYTASAFLVVTGVASLVIEAMFWRWMMLKWKGLANLIEQQRDSEVADA